MQYYTSSHSVYYSKYHIVWVTKYRQKILNPAMYSYLQKIMPKLLRSLPSVEIEPIGFDEDHLHMMMLSPPKYSISDVMGKLKSQSSHHGKKRSVG
ncbi:TPA: IS200/IS605 family transposase [Vibrio parahaemolyticus]